jgi:peptidoglycan L-alanyl-D-glutamate endopeptidase CwlK
MILKAERLNTVHPDLAAVVRLAATYITEFDLLVVEGARTLAKQKEYVAKGASRTLNSKHLPGPDGYARAVDLAPQFGRQARWDWPLFTRINNAMQLAAQYKGTAIVWGGHWRKFPDGPHFELK